MISSKDIENVNLVYKDANNNIVKVKLSLDNNESEIIGVASGEHVLIAAMVDDKAPDYLVSKGGRLSLYNEANEVKFTAEFDESIESALQYFSIGKSGYIGFSSGNNYYITNLRGELLEGFPLYGSGKALFTDLNKDGSTELVTSDPQGLVVCYELGL